MFGFQHYQLTILQVVANPDLVGFVATSLHLRIGTVQIPSQRVVEFVLLNYDFNGGIICPWRVRFGFAPGGYGQAHHSSPKNPAIKFSADLSIRSCVLRLSASLFMDRVSELTVVRTMILLFGLYSCEYMYECRMPINVSISFNHGAMDGPYRTEIILLALKTQGQFGPGHGASLNTHLLGRESLPRARTSSRSETTARQMP